MKEYRTEEQFLEVCESTINGNWSQAAEECIEYGFYASDLVEHQSTLQDEERAIVPMNHLVILAECMTEHRYNSLKK